MVDLWQNVAVETFALALTFQLQIVLGVELEEGLCIIDPFF